MCDQQSLRPACAYAQPDQSLCLSLEYSMIVKLLTERHLEFLSITGGYRGPSESTLVKMSNCWKSRALAHLVFLNKSNKTDRKAECICIIFTEDLFEQTLYLALKRLLYFAANDSFLTKYPITY